MIAKIRILCLNYGELRIAGLGKETTSVFKVYIWLEINMSMD